MIAPGLQAHSIAVWRMPNPAVVFGLSCGLAFVLLCLFVVLIYFHPITVSAGGGVMENAWVKPSKFALSFCVYFGTIALVVRRLSRPYQLHWATTVVAFLGVAAFLFNMAYIAVQAGRGDRAHYNQGTPLTDLLHSLMGTGAAVLMLVLIAIALVVLLDSKVRMNASMRLAIISGFLLTALATSLVGEAMVENGGRYIGIPSPQNLSLPFLGWSMEVGDLRPAHFFAMHAMQAIPAIALFTKSIVLISTGIVIYAGGTLLLYLGALAHIPVFTMI